MLQIVVPMAGAGKRFADAGYRDPKPLIRNLRPQRPHGFVFICQAAHLRHHDLASRLTSWGEVICSQAFRKAQGIEQ